MKTYDVIIIGGGAAGLYLAAALGGRVSAAVVERGERVGKKLSATGGGQGNLSNMGVCAEKYFGDRGAIADVLGDDRTRVLKMFDGLLTADARGRIYPAGRQASSLTDCLRRKASACADVLTGMRVTGIKRGFIVSTDKGELRGKRVVLCTGGMAGRGFGTDGSAYALARAFGHTVTELHPSLVQLKTDSPDIKTLRGVRADCIARVLCGEEYIAEAEGEVIFGDGAVGGSAVFYVSPFVTGKRGCTLELEFLPGVSEEEIAADVRRKQALGIERSELLAITLNNMLGRAVIRRTHGGAADIAHTVKHFALPVSGTTGFDGAQVTRGGVPLGEVTRSLESRLERGLYFAGEILDVDGECGGYNLHWAWASALRVAESITGEKLL